MVNEADILEPPKLSDDLEPECTPCVPLRRMANESLEASEADSQLATPSRPHEGRMIQRTESSKNSILDTLITVSSASFSSQISNYRQKVSNWNVKVLRETKSEIVKPQPLPAVQPPRPPRDGFEWVWFAEGYWAERERRGSTRKKQKSRQKWFRRDARSQSSSPSVKMCMKSSSPPKIKLPQITVDDCQTVHDEVIESVSRRSSNMNLRQGIGFTNPTHPYTNALDGELGGLYYKTKRYLRSRFKDRAKMVRLQDYSIRRN